MKKLKLLVSSFATVLSMSFSVQVQAADPCRVYLCMAGAAQGARNTECSGDYAYYFSMPFKVYSYYPYKFLPEPTQVVRRNMLNTCSETDTTFIEQIQSKYGRLEYDSGS